jgi:hypothetical protein
LEDSEPNDISSIYSASISLENNESSDNSSINSVSSADISLNSLQESNDDFHSDLEQSLSDMSDVIGDSNKPGKIFDLFTIILCIYTIYKN